MAHLGNRRPSQPITVAAAWPSICHMLIKSELLAEENFLWRSNLPGGSIAPGGVCVTCNFAEPCAAVKLDCRCIVFVDVQQHYAALLLLACLGLADSDKFLAYAPAPGSWSHCHVIDLDNWRAPLKIKKLRNVAIAFVDGYLPHSKYFLHAGSHMSAWSTLVQLSAAVALPPSYMSQLNLHAGNLCVGAGFTLRARLQACHCSWLTLFQQAVSA